MVERPGHNVLVAERLLTSEILSTMPMPRVRVGLLHHVLDSEVVVYDSERDTVHLLDPTSACVFEMLEAGKTRAEIKTGLSRKFDDLATDELLALSIEVLQEAGLLEPEAERTQYLPIPEVNRREMLRKVAAAGVAGLLVPAISSLTASRAYAQASCTSLGNTGCTSTARACCANSGPCVGNRCCHNLGGSCGSNNGCCPGQGTCVSGVCTAALLGPGAPCSASNQCASGCCARDNRNGNKNKCSTNPPDNCYSP